MKSSRLITYAVFGIIAGLLFENKFLRVKQTVKDKRHRIKDKAHHVQDGTRHLRMKFSKMMPQ